MSVSALADVGNDLAPWQPCEASGWKRMQVKRAFEIVLGKMLQPVADKPDDEEVPYLKTLHVQWGRVELDELPTMWAAPWEIEQLSLAVGDLLVCEGGEVGRAARLTVQPPEKCIIQNALHRVRGEEFGHVGFLSYCLRQAADKGWFDVLCNRATIAHFTVEKFRDLWLYLPPVEVQKRIAHYLDVEIAQIDALVTEKKRMLALLEEKRAALVSRAVTQGFHSDVPLKPSGLDWLGNIPVHWKVQRCATLFTEVDERNEPDLPLLNVSINTGVTLRTFSDDRIESVAEDFTTYKVARKGQLVFNKMRFWQGAAGIAPTDSLTSPDYTVARISQALVPAFVELLFRLPQFSDEVRRYSYGMVDDRLRLYWNEFKNIRIPVPSVNEQNAIVITLAQERAHTAELEANLYQSITLLKERRSALIMAAVTGQLTPEAMSV